MKTKFRLAWFVLFVSTAIAYPSAVRSQSIILENYDQSSVPKNKDGDTYPIYYDGGSGVGGPFSVSIDPTDAVSGSSLLVSLNSPSTEIYAQYNPYGYNVGVQREFTHTYAACGYPPACGNPASWQFNTYTKFRFWIKVPTNSTPASYTGQGNCNVGLYIKNITNADSTVDEGGGGGHFYHMFSVEPTGTWWQVILNMHPTHERGPTAEVGYIPYITADKSRGGLDPANTYNYWDTLTRFYIQCNAPAGNPWKIDQLEFYADPVSEDDVHLASAITGSFVPSSNKVIVNWERQIAADSTNWDVRYAYSDIHALGWNNATPAPNGVVTPLGGGAYVEMNYSSTAIPTAGHSLLYIAVKSQAEPTKFNQIAIPLSAGAPRPPTPPPATPGHFDTDADGKDDIGIYRDGSWYILRSLDGGMTTVGWGGLAQDIPVPADYDGDGKIDIAIYRDGTWFIIRSSDGVKTATGWGGMPQDIPVPGDYDGDGKVDIAVYRDGVWFIQRSSDGGQTTVGWGGVPQDIPVPGDYDGDGKVDIAVYRDGVWFIRRSSDGGQATVGLGGVLADVPVPADYDGDGKMDVAVYRNGLWFIVRSSDGKQTTVRWGGLPQDIPVPADYDGDGKTDIAVYRNGLWFIMRSSDGMQTTVEWGGMSQDIPLN